MRAGLRWTSVGAALSLIGGTAYAQANNEWARLRRSAVDFIVHPANVCFMVSSSDPSRDILIPMRTQREWAAFLASHPGYVTITPCCDAAQLTMCSSEVSLAPAKSGFSQTGSVTPEIANGQCVKAYCQNSIGQWQWISGVGAATSNGAVVWAPGVSNPWNTWVMSFRRNTFNPPQISVQFTCQGHDWVPPSQSQCSVNVPPSTYYLEWGFNCWMESRSGVGLYSNPNCPVLAPQAPWNPTALYGGSFGGSGAPLQQCVSFQTC